MHEEHGTAGLTRRQALRAGVGAGVGAAALASLGSAALAQSATPAAGMTATMPVLTLAGAQAVLQAALAKAQSVGVPEVVAVVDAAGTLKAFGRMDGTPITSVDLAQDKAFTAASFHAPTDQLAKGVGSNTLAAASILKEPHIVLLGGGVPLMSGNTVIGAVGCSGGSEEQDITCAKAGAAALASS